MLGSQGANDAQVLFAVSHGQIPRPSDVKSGVPAELERICMRALAVDPNERYSSAADMQKDLRAFASELSTAVSALELGAFVAKEFAQERRDLRDRLEQQLSRSNAGAVPVMNLQNPLLATNPSAPRWGSNPSWSGPIREVTPATGSLPSFARVSSTGSPQSEMSSPMGSYSPPPKVTDSTRSQFRAVTDSEQPGTPRKGIIIAVVGGALLALGAIGGFTAHLFASDKIEATTGAASSVENSSASPSATLEEAPIAVASTRPVELEIHASPKHATIFLDGRELSVNPVVERVPRDGKRYEVRIEAPGYLSRSLEVTADRSARLEVELKLDRSRAGSPKPKDTTETPPTKKSQPSDPGLKTDNIDPWSQ